jgi:hypothetical protein
VKYYNGILSVRLRIPCLFLEEQFYTKHFWRHARDDNLAGVALEVSTSISGAVAVEGINF